MAATILEVDLTYEGGLADLNQIDFYDASQALIGFQRTLAIVTHLVLNDEVITQAPSLQGAQIILLPPEAGSFKIVVRVVTGLVAGVAYLGTAPRDTVAGHLIGSAYDYVVSEIMGEHVDYSKSLGQQYEDLHRRDPKLPKLDQSRFDSAVEKCQAAVLQMHRPIVASKTAKSGHFDVNSGRGDHRVHADMTTETYDYAKYSKVADQPSSLIGWVSSYNINTYKGRIYLNELSRPVSFELSDPARTGPCISRIVRSLSSNAIERFKGSGELQIVGYEVLSRSGRVKGFIVTQVKNAPSE